MMLFLYIILALPVLAAYGLSAEPSLLWLFLALAAIVPAVLFIGWGNAWLKFRVLCRLWTLVWMMLFGIWQFARLISFHFQGESFNEQFFFHLSWNTVAEAGLAYPAVFAATFLYILLVGVVALWVGGRQPWWFVPRRGWMPLILLPALLLDPDAIPLIMDRLTGGGEEQSPDPEQLDSLGLDPAALRPSPEDAVPGKNLVFIYLEGLEKIYTDETIFPGLTPNINRLAAEGMTFTDMRQGEGTGWTMGGLVASQCGTPLLHGFGAGGNDILQNGFLNRAVCLGDILDDAGYRQVFLGGATTRFAGKGAFLSAHGYHEVNGREELAPLLEQEQTLSSWGLYDDALFDIAVDRFHTLGDNDRPFNMTLLTLDTHHPNGDPSHSCAPYPEIDDGILHGVHCTDQLIADFIERIHDHPAWENTAVVLFSDHLAMRNTAWRFFPEDYERKLFFTVINAGRIGRVATPGTHMDVAPTVLDLLQVEHASRFLAGRSLLDAGGTTRELAALRRNTLEAIRQVNSNELTRPGTRLCSAPELVKAAGDELRIAGEPVTLSISGRVEDMEVLYDGYGVLALLEEDGTVQSTFTVDLRNLPHMLYQFKDDLFLLVAASEFLPVEFARMMDSNERVGVFWGNLQGRVDYLGGTGALGGLEVRNGDCEAEMISLKGDMRPQGTELLQPFCPERTEYAAHVDPAAEDIVLPRVVFGGSWFEARLEPVEENVYRAVRNGEQEPPPKESLDYCHAYYGNGDLIIPRLTGDDGGRALHLRMIGDEELLFEVVED